MAGQELVIDVPRIKKAAHNAVPLTVTSYTLPHDMEVYMAEVLEVFLVELGQARLKDYLSYCLRELAVNAKKANTKRVYFESLDLDLANEADYEKGMESFKQDTLDNIQVYLAKLKEKGLYVKILFHAQGNSIKIEVRNNVEINKTEYLRIHDKLARSRKFNSLEEAMASVLDSSEGAGLGIVIMVLMLKKMGLSEDCFDIWAENGETVARITVPFAEARVESVNLLTEQIVSSISSLPQFPENVAQIQRLINDPNSQMIDIAHYIATDPALTADLLKLVNSASFMMTKRVNDIVEAVKLAGLKQIKMLLFSYGTMKVLGDNTEARKALWEHCYKTAYYAYNLVKNFKPNNKVLLDDSYVSGMLHDMGKIIFQEVHPSLLDKIRHFCIEKGIETSTFEDLAGGMNHAEIGARIAEKWNFPESLVSAIRWHHEPTLVPPQHKDVVYTVYLANVFCEYEVGAVTWDQVDPQVLADFNLKNDAQLKKVVTMMSEGFRNESRRLAKENSTPAKK
ncbi:MAG: HDOD domain-containing protein [Rectinemataceae bacterium]